MNTCPVFRRSGGSSYGYIVPCPIGSLLAPLRQFGSLPCFQPVWFLLGRLPGEDRPAPRVVCLPARARPKKGGAAFEACSDGNHELCPDEAVGVAVCRQAHALALATTAPCRDLWSLEPVGTSTRAAADATPQFP
jgi:hypothetical protein